MRVLGKWIVQLLMVVAIALTAFLIIALGYVKKSRNRIMPHDFYPVSENAQALHE